VIAEILPACVAAVEVFGDVPGAELFPAERAALSRAAEPRRAEFATGRWCARAALARFGIPAGPILRGPYGEPQWPAGMTGSITHCSGYRASAVAPTAQTPAIGIDAEPDGPLPDGVLDRVARPEEQAWLREVPAAAGFSPDRLLFCAKEAAYKAWFTLTGRSLSYQNVAVRADAAAASFTASVLADGQPEADLPGRWLADQGLILTAVTVLAA
jgi:4'-phosphopantetheinyl transferase EntD